MHTMSKVLTLPTQTSNYNQTKEKWNLDVSCWKICTKWKILV